MSESEHQNYHASSEASADTAGAPTPLPDRNDGSLLRNFVALIVHQSLFRIAWIFKTESVVIPAFLDTITNSGTARGILPLINRVAQSVTPLVLSGQMSGSRLKTRWLQISTVLMGLPFLLIGAAIFLLPTQLPVWFAGVFFLLYAVFFCVHGVNEISFSTVVGKLIPVSRRGRLMALSASTGSVLAVVLAWWLMGRWLADETGKPFGRIFVFVGTGMLLSAGVLLAVQETEDEAGNVTVRRGRHFRDAIQRIRQDRVLRRLCLFASLFVFSQILFPHYQRLGLDQTSATPRLLMIWVVAQHIGASVFSSISGLLADRFGNRLALRFLTVAAALAPALAMLMAWQFSVNWFFVTFFWLGLVPVTFRIQSNYALEIVDRAQHPAYISTMRLCMAVPFLLSPFIGWMVDVAGFVIPFSGVTVILVLAALLTWFMDEPRSPSAPRDLR